MARILLVGSDRDTEAFARLLDDSHQVTRSLSGSAAASAEVELVVDLVDDSTGVAAPALYPQSAIVFASILTTTATERSARAGRPIFGLSFLPGAGDASSLLEISAPLGTAADDAARASALLAEATGRSMEMLEDRVALVSARILAMVINEAAFALMERVADAADIDTAMKLGTNYPNGPLAWVDTIGADRIVAILDALHREYGEERYRPAVLLKQHARARHPFHSVG